MAKHERQPDSQAQHHHRHRSRTERRSRRRRDERPTSPVRQPEDAPSLDELRKERVQYYSRSPEERRHRQSALKNHDRDQRSSIPRTRSDDHAKAKRHRRHHRHRLNGATKPESGGRDRDDETVFVYQRTAELSGDATAPAARDEPSNQNPESQPETQPDAQVRRAHSRQARTSHQKQTVVVPDSEESSSSESASEESSSEAKSHTSSPPRTPEDTTGRRTSSKRHERAHKPGRSYSTHEIDRPGAERPSLRRSYTTTQARPVSMRAYPKSAPTAPSVAGRSIVSSAYSTKKSGGLFSSLFKSSPPAPEKRVQCLTCMSDVLVSRSAKLACGHRMCHACLKRIFTMSVTDPQHMPPKCCTQDHIPLKHVDRLFNDRFKILWNRKYQEYTTKNRIYCPAKGCGEWIKPSNIHLDTSVGRKVGKCSRCKTKVCCLCNGKWHARKDCPKDEETQKFVEVAKKAGWQRCFNCKAMVELKEGCNHMTCRCTAEFCMLCGNVWKTCDCPWFNYAAVEADRLNHMNVPEPIRVFFQNGNQEAAARHRDRERNPNPRNPALTYQQEMDRRRAQERADEDLARRLQQQTIDDPGIDGDIGTWGFANAGAHFRNENFFIRNAAGIIGNALAGGRYAPRRTASRRNRASQNNDGAAEQQEDGANVAQASDGGDAGLASQELRPVASTMAGLAPDGSRRGADRVGGWLQHVEEDREEWHFD